MHRFFILSAFFVASAVLAPMAMKADDHPRRYYDRNGKDYHTWDDHEDRAYRVYLGEQHRDYLDFGKVRPAQQQEYFKWRHEHSDAVLKIDVR
jgi:hypothetical protein